MAKKTYIICNAHLDPIWQWEWEEGAAAALSTFRAAADLADEFDYIFCHNEVTVYKYVEEFSKAYFRKNGVQINLNIMDLEELKDAINHPENPDYQNIIVKVTGYTSRFVTLSKSFQEEFVSRNNYEEFYKQSKSND